METVDATELQHPPFGLTMFDLTYFSHWDEKSGGKVLVFLVSSVGFVHLGFESKA